MTATIIHYKVEIADSTGFIGSENKFETKELEIIGENERYMVVKDLFFTTIDKRAGKYSIGSPLGKESIGITAGDSVWGNRVTYSLYTFKRKKAESIRKEIEAAIIKKFGFFMSGIDLSVIKEPAKGAAA